MKVSILLEDGLLATYITNNNTTVYLETLETI